MSGTEARWLLPCALLALGAACTDATDPAACDAAPESPEDGPDAAVTDRGETVRLTGALVDFASLAYPPIIGATVSIVGQSAASAATTDESGAFVVENVPANAEVIAQIEHSRFGLGYTRVLQTSDADFTYGVAGMLPAALLPSMAQLIGIPYDAKTTLLLFVCTDERHMALAGCTLSSDTATAFDPLYISASGIPDATLTATTALGAGSLGIDREGDHQVHFSHSDLGRCVAGGSDGPTSPVRVRTFAGDEPRSIILRGICFAE